MTSKNSWREMARVAGTPRPEYRARTSRSADRYQRDVLPPRRLESILPAGFQYSQKIRLRVRNRAPWSAQISDQERDRHCHRAFDLMADSRESRSPPATMHVRDSQSECICNSAVRDYRDGTACPRSSRGRSTRRNRCNRQRPQAEASWLRLVAQDTVKQFGERTRKRCPAEEREVSCAKRGEEPRPAPSEH